MTMRVSAKFFVSVLLSCTLVSTVLAQTSDPRIPQIEVGGQFPGLLFPSMKDGKLTSMSAFRGKKTIVHVFASW